MITETALIQNYDAGQFNKDLREFIETRQTDKIYIDIQYSVGGTTTFLYTAFCVCRMKE